VEEEFVEVEAVDWGERAALFTHTVINQRDFVLFWGGVWEAGEGRMEKTND
jgi:hypothetical protein